MRYKIFDEDYLGERAEEIEAISEYSAALQYAEWYNTRGDYELMDSTKEIIVENPSSGERKTYIISAERSVQYNATEIKITISIEDNEVKIVKE